MDDEWQTMVQLPETPTFWRHVFHPRHTAWNHETREFFREKADALNVLFLQNPHFLRNGSYVIRQYMEWCDDTSNDRSDSDYRLHDIRKAKAFLEHRVKAAQERWYDDAEYGIHRNNTVEECAVNAFRSAICHLNAVAKWQGYDLQLLEHESIKVMRDRMGRDQNVARAAPRDYAASSRFLGKRLTKEEMENITTCWWDGSGAVHVACSTSGRERAQVRGLLFHCLQKPIGRRGDEIRNLRNAMLFLHELKHVQPSHCVVVGASLRHAKENAENTEHLIGWMRSEDRWACPIGALACYFVWLVDITGVPILEEIRRDVEETRGGREWWKRMLFITDTNTDVNETPMSYATHHKSVHAGYRAIGTTGKTAATHIYRSTRACDDLESGASFLDVGVYQGWYHDNAADVYLRGAFKSASMLRANGWEGVEGFACWWEGEESDIPYALKSAVFPELDDLMNLCEVRYKETGVDRSSVEFLKVLRYLRKVFLEDAIVKREAYPQFPAYARHPVFQLPEWPEYGCSEKKRQMDRENVATKKKREMHESISEMLETTMKKTVETTMKNLLKDMIPCASNSSQRKAPREVPTPNDPIEMPKPATELPEIPEPTCLYTCYQVWQKHRDYFYATPLPPWKKRFGDRAATMKLRYSRMRPFLMYLDRCGAGARRVLDALEAFRSERKVAASVFIKQCFYHLEYNLTSDCKKPPPILPEELRERMERDSLPTL